ncbi:hypothetical protein FKW77_010209 [Venturia effusa]|uniref:Uncharacterized protein n=1 Tax=Venturia effusa TaxID=50376 RepID=A0A517L0D3_9PEZI|nr:hypothetical protein FKW77_010209 [Venturia effusa]
MIADTLLPAAIPTFTPTSSPELDALLDSIRAKVFVPSYLNKKQLQLVRSTKAKAQLENDPVYATFGDEEIRLTHLDVTKDQPRSKVLFEFKDLAKESRDWANLPALLEGWHHARPNTSMDLLSRLVREASKAGQLQMIIQCLWQVEKNGLSLANDELRFDIIDSIRSHATKSGLGTPTKSALRQIQTVLELMEKPEHCGSRTISDSDPRAEPHVIGVALELAALRANHEFGGKDEDGVVATYFNRLISALGQQKSEVPHSARGRRDEQYALHKFVHQHVPVWHALKLAKKLLGQSISAKSRQTAEKYRKDIGTKLNLRREAAQGSSQQLGVFQEWERLRTQ